MTEKYITEVLKEINIDPMLLYTAYKKHGNGGPLGKLFYHAFTDAGRFQLPEGTPPFKPAIEPMGMTKVRFINQINSFHLFCDPSVSKNKKEMIFIQMCESIHPSEADVLIAIKDQTLDIKYPNITAGMLKAAGFLE